MLGIHWPYFTASIHIHVHRAYRELHVAIDNIVTCLHYLWMWSTIAQGRNIPYYMYINGITFMPSGKRISSVVLQSCHILGVHFNHLLSQDLLRLVSHVELPSATNAGLPLLHHQQRLRVPPLRNTFTRHSYTV